MSGDDEEVTDKVVVEQSLEEPAAPDSSTPAPRPASNNHIDKQMLFMGAGKAAKEILRCPESEKMLAGMAAAAAAGGWTVVQALKTGFAMTACSQHLLRAPTTSDVAALDDEGKKKPRSNLLGEKVSEAKVLNDPARIEQGKAASAERAVAVQEKQDKLRSKRVQSAKEMPLIERAFQLAVVTHPAGHEHWFKKRLTNDELLAVCTKEKWFEECKQKTHKGFKQLKRDERADFLLTMLQE